MEEYTLLVTGIRACDMQDPWPALEGPYLNALHERSWEKMMALYPDWPPYPVVRRINREVEALHESKEVFGLLIADDAIKALRAQGGEGWLTGHWEQSYYGWLMDLLEEDPLQADANLFIKALDKTPISIRHKGPLGEHLGQAAANFGFSLVPWEKGWQLCRGDVHLFVRSLPICD